MKTTFWRLLDTCKITIPIIQRDYVQGRDDKKTKLIRKELLDTIKKALDNNTTVDFDFVYGTSTNGVLCPLDGQQRLTTLFLLHWYVATKSGLMSDPVKQKLLKFSYQTRVSSQRFCKQLISFSPIGSEPMSVSIKDQPWFAFTWKNDPTITAMLCMLDDIQSNFKENHAICFEKLTTQDVIYFHFLDMGNLSEDLYIKMNARGKPLTDFENFKARFEGYLEEPGKAKYKKHLVENVDGKWTDMFWSEMGTKMDDGFMNYFDYITEVGFYLQFENEKLPDNDIELKFCVFKNNDFLDLLFNSLDSWSAISDKKEYFERFFYLNDSEFKVSKVRLYDSNLNLFERCVKSEHFSAKDKLMLYALILQGIDGHVKRKELRLIRNLLINSPNEIRAENMHGLYISINEIMSGNIDYIQLRRVFSTSQVEDEQTKAMFIEVNPQLTDELYHFEDHYILMGRLSAFELLPDSLNTLRKTFTALFDESVDRNVISQAVLCYGDYSQEVQDGRWKFANSNNSWHSILTSRNIDGIEKTKRPLMALMEDMQTKTITEIIDEKLNTYKNFDLSNWQYYFIKYLTMNEPNNSYGRERQNNYVWNSDNDIRMLDTSRLSGYWRDPYLWTVYSQLTKEEQVQVKDVFNIGKDKKPLNIKGIEFSICEQGWQIKLNSTDTAIQSKYEELCVNYYIQNTVLAPSGDWIEVAVKIIRDILDQYSKY